MSDSVIPPTRAVHERQPHLFVLLVELAQRVGERLERAVHVGLQHEVERGDLAPLRPSRRCPRGGHRRRGSSGACGSRRDGDASAPRRPSRADLLVGRDAQLVARERDVVEAEHLDRRRRTGLLHLLAVCRRTWRGPCPSRRRRRPGRRRGACRARRATVATGPRPWSRFDSSTNARAGAFGFAASGGSYVGDEQDRLEQLVDADARRGGDLVDDRVATPLLGDELAARRAAGARGWGRRSRGRPW